jgi:tetratricopeptide (TPR) repeat protein
MQPIRLRVLLTVWGTLPCLFLLGLFSVRPVLSQEAFVVEGQVTTEQGAPPPTRVSLRVETSDGQLVVEQSADSKGQFRLIIQRGNFLLTATADGFETFQQPLRVFRGTGRYVITIVLKPRVETKARAGVVSATELNAPKNARKACEKGERAFQKGKLAEARKQLERAVALHPCYARAHTHLGMTLVSLGDLAAAESAFKKAIGCDAGFLEAHVQLGILLDREGRFAESLAHLEGAIRRFPSSWQLHFELAAAQYGLGHYPEAEQEYLKAQSIEPTVPAEIHVRLANVYTQMRIYDKAYAELQAYLRAEPDGRFATRAAAIKQRMETGGLVRSPQPQQAQSRSQEK